MYFWFSLSGYSSTHALYTYLRIHYILYLVYIVYMGTCMYSQAFLSTLVCVCGGVSFMFFVGGMGFLMGRRGIPALYYEWFSVKKSIVENSKNFPTLSSESQSLRFRVHGVRLGYMSFRVGLNAQGFFGLWRVWQVLTFGMLGMFRAIQGSCCGYAGRPVVVLFTCHHAFSCVVRSVYFGVVFCLDRIAYLGTLGLSVVVRGLQFQWLVSWTPTY